MQGSRNFGHRTGRSVTFIALFIVLALSVAPSASAKKTTKTKNSPSPVFFEKTLIAGNERAQIAIKKEPLMTRDMMAEAPLGAVLFFYTLPDFSARLLEDYGQAPASLTQDEDDGKKGSEWLLQMREGGRYRITVLKHDKNGSVLFFSYFLRAPIGIALKISGAGVIVTRVRQGNENKIAFIDYDLYLTPGSLPLDKYAAAIDLHALLIAKDIRLVVTSLIDLIETAVDDPETMADDMAFSEDLFTTGEQKAFARHFDLGLVIAP